MAAPASASAAASAAAPAAASLEGKRVWVSGGSGFLGGALIQRLLTLHRVAEVKAIGRSQQACDKIKALGATPFLCDLSDVACLTSSLAGADVAFHSAAHVGDWEPSYAPYHSGTVVGTAHVIQACRDAQVPRLVHVSTEAVLVNDAHEPLRMADEEKRLDAPASEAYPYSRSKAEAEELVLRANDERLTTVVVRPRYIWGKGDTVIFPRLADMQRKGMLIFVGSADVLTSTCHVSNVCEGLELAAVAPREIAGGRAYFVTDPGAPRSVRQVWGDMLATQGLSSPTRAVPWTVAYGAAVVMEHSAWLLSKIGLSAKPLFTRQSLALLGQEMTVDCSRARRELGYEGKVSWEAGLAEMKEEFEQQKAGAAASAANSK